jgi:hypothetical protein
MNFSFSSQELFNDRIYGSRFTFSEWRKSMKTAILAAAMLVFCLANVSGQGKVLTVDPLTALPVIPTTVSKFGGGNEPTKMPDAMVCKSKMQADFYSDVSSKVDATVAWYASHLTGFKKFDGYDSARSQDIFYNPDRTILVVVTGSPGAKGENTDTYAVAYERYQPGLSEKTITALTQGKVVCP